LHVEKDNLYLTNCSIVNKIVIIDNLLECHEDIAIITNKTIRFLTKDSIIIDSSPKLENCNTNKTLTLDKYTIRRIKNKISINNVSKVNSIYHQTNSETLFLEIFQHNNTLIKEYSVKESNIINVENSNESIQTINKTYETFFENFHQNIVSSIEKIISMGIIEDVILKFFTKIWNWIKNYIYGLILA
jgi:hypothetical protein